MKKEKEKSSTQIKNVNFKDADFMEMIQTNSDPDLQKFLEHLAVCHTALYSEKESGGSYQASSPDELALVSFSKFCGVEFKGHSENETININCKNFADLDKPCEF